MLDDLRMILEAEADAHRRFEAARARAAEIVRQAELEAQEQVRAARDAREEDAVNAVAFVSPRLAGGLGVFGNSLGAIVGVHLAVRAPEVRSLVASGCPTRVSDFAASGFRRVLLAGMRAIATAVPIRISVNHFIPYRRILRDPCIIDQVRRDPLVADARRFTPSTYADMLG